MSYKNMYLTDAEERTIRNQFLAIMLVVLAIILILTIGALCIIRVDYIMKTQTDIKIMQTDTLDQVTELRQEVESIKVDQKNRSQVNSVALISLSDTDRMLIERIVMSESSIEGLRAQMAVAQTIYDRMNDWGYSVEMAVCPGVYNTKDNGSPTDSVKLAVCNIFDKGMRIYEGGTYQFHDDTVNPYWTEGKIARGSIGRLSFYGGYAE